MSREDLRDAIAELRAKPKTVLTMLLRYELIDKFTVEDVLGHLESWITESDQSNSFIAVDWF